MLYVFAPGIKQEKVVANTPKHLPYNNYKPKCQCTNINTMPHEPSLPGAKGTDRAIKSRCDNFMNVY